MGTVLFTWELGAGLGHLMQILPLARELSRRNHRVFAALRDTARATSVFGDGSVVLLQAPVKVRRPMAPIRPPHTFAHILHNIGFEDDGELAGLVAAWRSLFSLVNPDVIVFDHSPTALLAARGTRAAKVTIGSGFCCPLDESPLPDLRPWQPIDARQLLREEERILEHINALLRGYGLKPLDRVTQLYSDIDDIFLTTFRELDHYPARPSSAQYQGIWFGPEGKAPIWPAGDGLKVYAYMKRFAALTSVLTSLRERACPTIVVADGVSASLQHQFASENLRFETDRLDMTAVARECDVAISNGNHGTTAAILLGGKPLLQIPMYLEQAMLVKRVCDMGAGLHCSPNETSGVGDKLAELLESARLTNGAGSFASRYRGFDPKASNDSMATRIESLMRSENRREWQRA